MSSSLVVTNPSPSRPCYGYAMLTPAKNQRLTTSHIEGKTLDTFSEEIACLGEPGKESDKYYGLI